jgi:hypothetical protein
LSELSDLQATVSHSADVPLSGKNVAYSTTNFTDYSDLHNTNGNREHEKILKEDLWDDAVQAYLALVSFADAQFGRLLETLEKNGLANNTIIVLWSDHGWHLGEKEHWRKATLWEEVTRVPLIIYAPGFQSNKISAQSVSLIDIYPLSSEKYSRTNWSWVLPDFSPVVSGTQCRHMYTCAAFAEDFNRFPTGNPTISLYYLG